MARLSTKLETIKDDLSKLQLAIIQKGWNVDLERVLILLESNVDSLRRYDNLEEGRPIEYDPNFDADICRNG